MMLTRASGPFACWSARKVLNPPMTSLTIEDMEPDLSRSTTMWVPFGRACCWLSLVDGLLVIVCLS